MRKTELREVTVHYCDVCGAEIVGIMTTFNQGLANEKHACHAWIESEEIRCDQKLDQQLLKHPVVTN